MIVGLVTITTGVLSGSVEPPDDSTDPPGQATAASCASSEASKATAECWGNGHEDSGQAHSTRKDKALNEAPEEPLDVEVVDWHGSVISLSSDLHP